MRLILGGINGHYLRNITDNATSKTEEVVAAVAYATDAALLFDWCWDHKIALRYYGRLDASVAVSVPILRKFLARRSPNHTCRLVQHHHAKVIWWRGVGLYIGSANLSGPAWYNNVEAGCFFPEENITDEMAGDIHVLFSTLEEHSTPLTEELLAVMEKRAKALNSITPSSEDFWASPSLKKWAGLVQIGTKTVADKRREAFLAEWHSTLQDLRDIGARINVSENRPSWVNENTPPGAQADQFLHAYYYQQTFEGRKAQYAMHFETNKSRREAALSDAIGWWRQLTHAPEHEDKMLNSVAPNLREALSEESLKNLDEATLREICMGVNSIRDYARRVPNRVVGLPEGIRRYNISEKVTALSHKIWNSRSSDGKGVGLVLSSVLYQGSDEELPDRLWRAVSDPKWKIDGLGISALGEIVGWARPDKFPPRNGRTSKALRSLGYDVEVHVE